MIARWWRRRLLRSLLREAEVIAEVRALILEPESFPDQPFLRDQALVELEDYVQHRLVPRAARLGAARDLAAILASAPAV